MKKILLIISVVCLKEMATSQYYYGGNVGVTIEKSYDYKAKKERHGINDLYLSIPLGYATKYMLFDITPSCTMSMIPSITGSIGGKIDFGEHSGLHLLAGYRDEMAVTMKPLAIYHFFNPNITGRLWFGNFLVQGSYVIRKKEFGGNSLDVGIGVIGF